MFKNTRGWNGHSLKLHGITFDEFLGLLLAETEREREIKSLSKRRYFYGILNLGSLIECTFLSVAISASSLGHRC